MVHVVMFAWGNPSRGDDAVGPWFADYVRDRDNDGLTLVEDFQLQVEHLLDCQQGDLLLFVDACSDKGGDLHFEEVSPTGSVAHTSHALTPAELLGYYQRLFPKSPPPAFQLSIPGADFELGQQMSSSTKARCLRGARLLENLLRQPALAHWRQLARPQAETCHA
jgi:hydrogenase maturation protease